METPSEEKRKVKLITITIILLLNEFMYSQNITNTLGTGGVFTIKDASNNYLTLTQSTGEVNILKTLRLENTTSSTTGVIYKGADRFLHNYGTQNIFMGVNSGNFTLTGTQNSAFGFNSLYANTSGNNNSAFGYMSIYANTRGRENSAFGYFSLRLNTTGSYNSAFGSNSLGYNTSGGNNSAFGSFSLRFTTGSNNSAFGTNSLMGNTTGSGNSGFGYFSGANITTGNNNTAVGQIAGSNISTGSNNTAIGFNAQVPSGTSDNQVRIGNTDVTYAGVQVAWTITSDLRLKSNIHNSNLGLNFITKLNPVSYTRINDDSKKTEYGFIAQEVEEVLKQEGIENSGMLTIDDKGMYELRYNDLLAPMVKAIQELSGENNKLKTENDGLTKNNIELTTRLSKLEQIVNEMQKQNNNINVSNK